jgi:Na+/pantothenate symporter
MKEPAEQPDVQGPLLSRIKGSFTPIYLTILSIVQAVALGELAKVVADGYPEFTPVQWSLVLLTFLILIIIWSHVTTDAMSWVWIPDLRDSVIPFLLGAFELYQAHAIVVGLGPWLFGMGAGATLAVLEFFHVGRQVRLEADDAEALRLFRRRSWSDLLQGVGGIVLFFALGLATVATGVAGTADQPLLHAFEAALPWAALFLTGLWLGVYLLRTTLYWRALVTLARSGRLPAETPLNRLVGMPLR